MRIHSEETPYLCTTCGKSFKGKRNLTQHQKSHSEQTPYKCSTCGKEFKRKNCLTVHQRLHTGERPYVCSLCGKGFSQSQGRTSHMKTHSKETSFSKSSAVDGNTFNKILVMHKEVISVSNQTEELNFMPKSISTWNEGNLPRLHYVDDPFVINIKTECDD